MKWTIKGGPACEKRSIPDTRRYPNISTFPPVSIRIVSESLVAAVFSLAAINATTPKVSVS